MIVMQQLHLHSVFQSDSVDSKSRETALQSPIRRMGFRRKKKGQKHRTQPDTPTFQADVDSVIAEHASRDPEVRVYDDAVVDFCVAKLMAAGDGGEADLDVSAAAGVECTQLPAALVGCVPWRKVPGEEGDDFGDIQRGDCLLCVPDGSSFSERGPRCIFLHGGVNIYYSPEHGYRPLATRLAAALGFPVLVPDFRKAPGHRFPGAWWCGRGNTEVWCVGRGTRRLPGCA